MYAFQGMHLCRRAQPLQLPPGGHARLRGPLQSGQPALSQRLPHATLKVCTHEASPFHRKRKHGVTRLGFDRACIPGTTALTALTLLQGNNPPRRLQLRPRARRRALQDAPELRAQPRSAGHVQGAEPHCQRSVPLGKPSETTGMMKWINND